MKGSAPNSDQGKHLGGLRKDTKLKNMKSSESNNAKNEKLTPIEQSCHESTSSKRRLKQAKTTYVGNRKQDADSTKSNYFVSNVFIEKLFEDISKRQSRYKSDILEQIEQMEEKVLTVMSIKQEDMP